MITKEETKRHQKTLDQQMHVKLGGKHFFCDADTLLEIILQQAKELEETLRAYPPEIRKSLIVRSGDLAPYGTGSTRGVRKPQAQKKETQKATRKIIIKKKGHKESLMDKIILTVQRSGKELTSKEIADALGVRSKNIQKILWLLEKDGRVEKKCIEKKIAHNACRFVYGIPMREVETNV